MLFKFLKAKKRFFPPKKSKFLILDVLYSDLFKKILKKDYQILKIRYEEINIFILFRLIISFKKINFFNYVIEYISYCNPKIIVCGNDNLLWLYKIKKEISKVKLICAQNGFRNLLFFEELKKNKNLSIDYIFTFNNSFSKLYKKRVNCKTIKLGSLKNNSVNISRKFKKSGILFISQGYPTDDRDFNWYGSYSLSKKIFYHQDVELLKNLLRYCNLFKLKLNFLTKNTGKEGLREIEFYKKFVRSKNLNFLNKNSDDDIIGSYQIYRIADKSLLTISTSSTFGLENLARGNKTVIVNNKKKITKNILDIFWNYKVSSNGIFWTNINNYQVLEKIINKNLNFAYKIWRQKTLKIRNELMDYDKNNSKIVDLIKYLSK